MAKYENEINTKVYFCNKRCSTIGLPSLISNYLNNILKNPNHYESEIKTAYSKYSSITLNLKVNTSYQKPTIYFYFDLDSLEESLFARDLSNSNLLKSLRRGYTGSTFVPEKRRLGHGCARNRYHLI